MNKTQVKCFLVLTVLAIIGFGPLSLTCLIGMYVVIERPIWFLEVVQNLYRNPVDVPTAFPPWRQESRLAANAIRIKCFLCLLFLLVLDIAPVPVTGSIGLYVVIMRPEWFKDLVIKIYCGVRG